MSKDQTVGILGGGQLAQMLTQAQLARAASVLVLCENAKEPAANATDQIILGGTANLEAIKKLCSQVGIVTYESEFIDCDLLEKASGELATRFVPKLDTMRLFQNKLKQKELLDSLNIASARYQVLPDASEEIIPFLQKYFPNGAMLKWAWRGYDGKGNFKYVPERSTQLDLNNFVNAAKQQGSNVYAEELIPFRRELAIIGVLSTTGEFKSYPLVLSEQRDNICLWVRGPAKNFGISESLEREISQSIERIMRASDLFGSAGFELFELSCGEILVNEIAPRVHNTGHYTQDGAKVSQFENHMRAVCGEALGDTSTASYFAMYNLLGPQAVSLQIDNPPLPKVRSGMYLHWYGKQAIRPGRKLGHINFVSESLAELERISAQVIEIESVWHKELRSI